VTAIAAAPAAGGDYPPAAASGANGAVRVSTADDRRLSGLSPRPTAGSAGAADRSPVMSSSGRTVRSWPLLILAAPAAAEVWSGWVGIAQKTGFGLVSPLPGIWASLHLDTSITLPVGVEAYAAYALRAWLASEPCVSRRTRRFAKWSAICSFGLGMGGQVAYHLLAQAGAARAPWAITTIVSCLPAGPGPGHGNHAGAHATGRHRHRGCGRCRDRRTSHPPVPGPVPRRPGPARPGPDHRCGDGGGRVQASGCCQKARAAGPRRGSADHGTGPPYRSAANRAGSPHRPQACRYREAGITASPAQWRSQGIQ